MKILVTGGAGFIGSHLVDKLIEQGHQVAVIDNLSTGKKEYVNSRASFYQLEIQDEKVGGVFKREKPEIVFHLAAHISVSESVKDPVSDCRSNIEGSINVFEAAKNIRIKKVIFSSTGGAMYGDAPDKDRPTPETYLAVPISPYGITKRTNELYLNYYNLTFNLPYIALRFGNVYGPRQNSKGEAGVVAIFIDKLLNNQQPTIYGDGLQTRDYVYVDDVVQACLAALENDEVGIYNVGTSVETNVNQIFQLINKFLGSNNEERHGPAVPEQRTSCLDNGLIGQKFDWQPDYNLEQGIKKTVDWFRKLNK